MTRRLGGLYPFLLAMVPILSMAAGNSGQASLDDLAVVLVAVLAGSAVVYLIVALAARRRWSGRLPPLATLAAVLWFYGYPKAVDSFARLLPQPHLLLAPLALGLTVALGWWLLKRPALLDRLTTFLTLTGILLIGWLGAGILANRWRAQKALQESELVRRLARPIGVRPSAASAGPRRDIYLIVLDEYANSRVTRERFGFDNRQFENSLRRLGFVIPRVVESNYIHTALSLPSLLNATHLVELNRELGHRADPTIPNYLVEHNRTLAFLRTKGYRLNFFPSQWWLSTRHNRNATYEFEAWPRLSTRELSHTELRRAVRKASMLGLFQSDHADDADHAVRTFEGLAQVPQREGPNFVFAHIMKPHRPFAFDQHCRPLPRRREGEASEAYIGQVQCLDSLVLGLVTTLLHASAVAPIILLQGDHGTKTLRASTAGSPESISIQSARERFGAFGAYYLPGGGAAGFGDTVTVVNVLGNVLRYYFNADLPKQPDEMYLSVDLAPYVFYRVDMDWLSGRDPTRIPVRVRDPR